MSNNRHYNEKTKLAFDKMKVGKRLVTNFILGNHLWMNVRWRIKTKGKAELSG